MLVLSVVSVHVLTYVREVNKKLPFVIYKLWPLEVERQVSGQTDRCGVVRTDKQKGLDRQEFRQTDTHTFRRHTGRQTDT